MMFRIPRLKIPARRRWPRGWMLPVPALGLFFATAVSAGDLSGTVRIVSEPRTPMRASLDPYAGTLNSVARPAEARAPIVTPRDVVVYLTGANAYGATPTASGDRDLRQINQSFEPHVLGVPVGTTVEFPNMDMVYHNVFSYSKTKRFDLGYYGKGKSRRVTFDQPGVVQVFCDIHSTMSAYIFVADTPLVTQPDDGGSYRLSGIPSGSYTLRVWHPDLGERSMKVTVADGSSTVDVNL